MPDRSELPDETLARLPKKPAPEFTRVLLPALSVGSGLLLGFAVPGLIDAQGFVDYLKAGVIAGAATGVSYGINRLAVEKGALQTAIGSRWAGLVSSASILAVGAGLFTATTAGLTISHTDTLKLQTFGQNQAAHIAERAEAAEEVKRIGPALDAHVADLAATVTCERQSNCLSGGSVTGEGAVFQAVRIAHQGAESIAAQVVAGQAQHSAALLELEDLQAGFQETLSDPGLSSDDRRIALSSITAEIRQALSRLTAAAPTSLVAAYAEGLRRPITIPGRPEASAKLNALRLSHADQLSGVVRSVPAASNQPPAFPGETGVSDAFAHMGHFLPIAMIVAVVELVFPITLWLYTLFAFQARIAREDPEQLPPLPDPTPDRMAHSKRGRPTTKR